MTMTTIGVELAEQVATLLERGLVICYSHRDYCGMGLRYTGGLFIYGEAHDSTIESEEDFARRQAPKTEERQLFVSRQSFAFWLANQSDQSLSGIEHKNTWLHNNQRLTRARLEKAVAFCKCTPAERWNAYAG